MSRLLLAASVLCLVASASTAGSPRLAKLSPPGGQAGSVVEVDLSGRFLDDPRELFLYEPGIAVESIKMVESTTSANGRQVAVDPGTRVRATLRIAKDCPLGAHGLRLRTAGGISEYHRFFVGAFPNVDEDEVPNRSRNDKRETAMEVPVNVTVNGLINEAADVDLYRIVVKKGQRISAEVEAARLGSTRGIPDLFLTIYDADGKKLAAADDSALFIQDPVLSILAEKDGPYFVEVRHGMYNGQGDIYRLHIGTFSRPTAVYPSGGPVGGELAVRLLGDPVGVITQTVKLPETVGDFAFAPIVDGVMTPSPNRLRVSPFGNVLEAEPNDTPEAVPATAVATLPIAFNGIIEKPGDVDCFRFRAKKGEQFKIHALANALGSPLDPVIWVKPVAGRGNPQRVADSRTNQLGLAPANGLNRDTLDSILEFTVPADGEYILGVEDERGAGGPDYVYRVEARPEENGVYTYIVPEAENQNQPQVRQTIPVPAGNQYTSQIGIFSTNKPFNGDLELVALNLPSGVTMKAPKLTPGMTRVPVVFEAAPGAKEAGALVDIVVRPVGGSESSIPSGYRQTICMNQYGNNDYYLHVPIAKLAVSVAEAVPFHVEVEQPKSALVQNGEMELKFKVTRTQGYEGPVTVQMDYRPQGINTATPVTLRGNQTEGTYIVGASRGATAGSHQLTLTAVTGLGGRRGYNPTDDRTLIASMPFAVTIAEPHVEAKIGRTSIERGKTATIVCKLSHLQAFDGAAKATLGRLPRGVELVESKEITSKDKDVTFTIRATSVDALVGNYQGIVMDVIVMEKGQPVRQLSGAGVLRIDSERGVQPKTK